MRIFVTGASGFIAKHCIAELLRNDFSIKGTLSQIEFLEPVKCQN